MEKTGKTRRVAVFQSDGTPLYDQVDHNTTTSSSHSSSSHNTLPASKLWPLIQVFVQFSREVQGGRVRRLIFRSPKTYAPAHHRFEPAPAPIRTPPVTAVYLAHSQHHVVAVTERLIGDAASTPNLLQLNSSSSVFTVHDFCHSLLDFLRQQHYQQPPPPPHFVDSPMSDAPTPRAVSANTNRTHSSFSTTSASHVSSSNSSSHSRISLPIPEQDTEPPPLPAVVSIDHAKLSEFIKRSLNTLNT